jgi:SAM-dependent methyltransferase
MTDLYNEAYFKNSTISNYIDYDERDYSQLAQDIIKNSNIELGYAVLDYGCATGKLLHCLNKYGVNNIFGYDISNWAIEHGKELYPELIGKISDTHLPLRTDLIICLDVFEHLTDKELDVTLSLFKSLHCREVICRMPICNKSGEDYVLQVSRQDKTHIQRKTKEEWIALFKSKGFNNITKINGKQIYDGEGVLACRMS